MNELLSDYPLTPAQISQYRTDGFLHLPNLFTGPTLAALRDAVASAVASEKQTDQMGRAREGPPKPKTGYAQLFIQRVNLWQRHPAVKTFVLSPRLGNLAAQLEGTPMRVWHDQALFKEPDSGNNKTPWHQDAVYWPHQDRTRQTTIWIALKDATIHNGCMSFVPGTHKMGAFPAVNLAHPQDIFAYVPHIKPVKPTTVELTAGSATFHNGLTFHFAGPNKSDATREAMAIIYMPASTTYDGTDHLLTDPLRNHTLHLGDPIDNEIFPLVSTP